MKNKSSNGRVSYFFTPRIHGNVLAWVKPASESKRSKQRVIENILRWEDDGGPMMVGPWQPSSHDKPGSGTGKRMMNEGS